MKYLYTLLLTLFVTSLSATAQVTVYHENMADPISGLYASEWVISNLTPSNTAEASGGRYVATSTAFKTDGMREKGLSLYDDISTIGYTNITLTWLDYRTLSNGGHSSTMNGNPVRLFYSVNQGVDYIEVTELNETVTFQKWVRKTVQLPVICNNVEDIRFRWVIANDNKHGDYYAIDDITITGTPEEGLSTLDWNNYPKNDDPFALGKSYTVEGRTVTFTKTSDVGVELPIARVTDSLFQTTTKTLTLVQKKATATTGSSIKIKFDEPVSDLTFTLFDVDQAQNQFQDFLKITGKGAYGDVTITPQKSKVITTSKNQYTSPNEFIGISGTDVPAASVDGNIKITFGAPVVEVTIVYHNTDGVRNADGQQGIGIHNLSWRKEQSIISPLPVTLVSFKGQPQQGATKLTWSTASEIDNDKFIVERSQDGKTFKTVGEVIGRGTTNLTQHYTFTDQTPVAGTNYYRLKQIDFDGAFEYSKTIAVNLILATSSAVYPTLATSDITVRLARTDEQVTILLTDMAGKQLAAVQNPSDRQVVMPVQHLQGGVYLVSVITGGHKEVFRFVKR